VGAKIKVSSFKNRDAVGYIKYIGEMKGHFKTVVGIELIVRNLLTLGTCGRYGWYKGRHCLF